MSILIKNMEMPKAGELLCIDILPDGKIYIHLDLENKQVGTAVPVPPHGRLIDADALMKQAFTQFDWNDVVDVEDIKNAPTIIPVEEGE